MIIRDGTGIIVYSLCNVHCPLNRLATPTLAGVIMIHPVGTLNSAFREIIMKAWLAVVDGSIEFVIAVTINVFVNRVVS